MVVLVAHKWLQVACCLATGHLKRGNILIQNDGAFAVDEYAAFENVLQGAFEYHAFAVAADAQEFGRTVGVVDAFNVLVDDGTFVKVGSNEVGGGADEFDAAVVGLFVGFGTAKAW